MKKSLSLIFKIILFAIIVMFAVKLLSNEDDWICSDGQWIKHGNPGAPMPEGECE